ICFLFNVKGRGNRIDEYKAKAHAKFRLEMSGNGSQLASELDYSLLRIEIRDLLDPGDRYLFFIDTELDQCRGNTRIQHCLAFCRDNYTAEPFFHLTAKERLSSCRAGRQKNRDKRLAGTRLAANEWQPLEWHYALNQHLLRGWLVGTHKYEIGERIVAWLNR